MLVLGLDVSLNRVGYALLKDGKILSLGTRRRGKFQVRTIPLLTYRPHTDYEFAEWMKVDFAFLSAEIKQYDVRGLSGCVIAYEWNRAPVPAERREAVMRSILQTGRVLQALGVEGERVQADNRSKKRRGVEMALVYQADIRRLCGKRRPSADALDALAVAHRMAAQKRVEAVRKRPC